MEVVHKPEDLILEAHSNEIELLEFWLEKQRENGEIYRGLYGINVSKVLEVIRMTTLTEVPNLAPYVLGVIQLRGRTIPVVSLAKWLNLQEPRQSHNRQKLIIAEFNDTQLGFLVHQTTRIRRMAWMEIKTPPPVINDKYDGRITGTVQLNDGQILLILDMEKIVAELSPSKEDAFVVPVDDSILGNQHKRILVVDDSLVARKQVGRVLQKGNFEVEMAVNGQEAWKCMEDYYTLAGKQGVPLRELIYLVLTDVEMPLMDGYTLTRKIKTDPRFSTIPVVLHSSLSGTANLRKGKQSGCDEYVTKFDPQSLFRVVSGF